jgi:serine protease Do
MRIHAMRATLAITAILLGACDSSGNLPAARNDSPASGVAASNAADSRLQAVANQTRPAIDASGLPDFAALVERCGDSVVNVEVVGRAQLARGPSGADSAEDPLTEFFRRFGIPGPQGAPPGESPLMRGNGSGFIVSPDGYILTNAHVVGEADEITVRLTDRREFTARLIGTDARTDVAVIKIDAEGETFPAVAIGDPSELQTGEWVLAIGSPFGLANTATAGIVSATSRSVGGGSPVPFIQTDVAVNPGNSGGPLFNLDGEVVGINSMIFSQSGGYMGISFAIPIDTAIDVRDQLIKTGKVTRGRIGVSVQEVDAALARSFELDRPRGALVSSVERGGPADKAGLKPGDVILAVDGEAVDQSAQLSNVIASIKPGDQAKLTIWRAGKERQITARVDELEESPRAASAAPRSRDTAEGNRFGLVVRPLTPEEKESADTEGDLVVQEVEGPAARAGIQPGDIILAVNNRPVDSMKDLRDAASSLQNKQAAALLVERDGAQLYVPVGAG